VQCGKPIRPQTVQQMVDRAARLPEGTRLHLYAPTCAARRANTRSSSPDGKRGLRARAHRRRRGRSLARAAALDKQKKHSIDVVVDRLVIRPGIEKRLADSLETALKVGWRPGAGGGGGAQPEETLSQSFACADCGTSLTEITPRLFSFNSPYGACSTCSGLGTLIASTCKVVVDPSARSTPAPSRPGPAAARWRLGWSRPLARAMGFSLGHPLAAKAPRAGARVILGAAARRSSSSSSARSSSYKWRGKFEGVPMLERRYKETDSQLVRGEIEKYMSVHLPRLRRPAAAPEALAVTVAGDSIDRAVVAVGGRAARRGRARLDLAERERHRRQGAAGDARPARLPRRCRRRLPVARARLGVALGRREPAHPARDADRQQAHGRALRARRAVDRPAPARQRAPDRAPSGMRDLGNSVLVVEHDEETIRAADWVVDLGPGAGVHGGEVVAEGTPEAIARHPESLTGRYLRGELQVPVPEAPAAASPAKLADHPRRAPEQPARPRRSASRSGCSRSSLAFPARARAASSRTSCTRPWRATSTAPATPPASTTRITGLEHLDKVIAIDQSPIGRTPRSNPATYTKVFGHIRTLMAKTPEARMRGYKPGRFSFNVKGGRCEACEGDGQIKIEMHFLPDLYVTCEVCGGKRYDRETLQVRYKGLNIAEILELTVEQGHELFRNVPAIARILSTLDEVGLGYLHLGQPATTLSGGEAQRVKLATELSRRATGRTLYLLDEPTTGLHFDDVRKLLQLLHQLVELGNTVIVIEHNLDVIKTADWVIDLGPEGHAAVAAGESGRPQARSLARRGLSRRRGRSSCILSRRWPASRASGTPEGGAPHRASSAAARRAAPASSRSSSASPSAWSRASTSTSRWTP
jgi:excinuclease ABC subunit A